MFNISDGTVGFIFHEIFLFKVSFEKIHNTGNYNKNNKFDERT